MDVVEAQGVRKAFGDLQALEGVELRLAAGELRGLVGPNGAGKTTLQRAVLGLTRPDAGTVTVLGAPAAPARAGIAGFVDAPRFYPYLSGRRNLDLLARLDGDRRLVAVEEALDRLGLRDRAGSRVGGWSTGMRQRLGVAAALLRRPRVLVLDEPTSGMDPRGVTDVHEILKDLAGEGTAVLLSSHDMVDVAGLCDSVTVLSRGRVRFSGTAEELGRALPTPVHLLRTSDDDVAEPVVRGTARGPVHRTPDGLRVTSPDTDAIVLALARRGVAVRTLVEESDPLTRAFLELTT